MSPRHALVIAQAAWLCQLWACGPATSGAFIGERNQRQTTRPQVFAAPTASALPLAPPVVSPPSSDLQMVELASFPGRVALMPPMIRLDAQGNLFVAGMFSKLALLGPEASAKPPRHWRAYLLKLSRKGAVVWKRALGRGGVVTATAMVVDSAGDVTLAGNFGERGARIDVGGGPLVARAWSNIFVAKLKADGTHVWSHRHGGWPEQMVLSGAPLQDGIALTGTYRGTLSFGRQLLRVGANNTTSYLAQLDGRGTEVSLRAVGSVRNRTQPKALRSAPRDVAVDGQGRVYLLRQVHEASTEPGVPPMKRFEVVAYDRMGGQRWTNLRPQACFLASGALAVRGERLVVASLCSGASPDDPATIALATLDLAGKVLSTRQTRRIKGQASLSGVALGRRSVWLAGQYHSLGFFVLRNGSDGAWQSLQAQGSDSRATIGAPQLDERGRAYLVGHRRPSIDKPSGVFVKRVEAP